MDEVADYPGLRVVLVTLAFRVRRTLEGYICEKDTNFKTFFLLSIQCNLT